MTKLLCDSRAITRYRFSWNKRIFLSKNCNYVYHCSILYEYENSVQLIVLRKIADHPFDSIVKLVLDFFFPSSTSYNDIFSFFILRSLRIFFPEFEIYFFLLLFFKIYPTSKRYFKPGLGWCYFKSGLGNAKSSFMMVVFFFFYVNRSHQRLGKSYTASIRVYIDGEWIIFGE